MPTEMIKTGAALSAEAYYNLAVALKKQNRLKEAEQHFRRAITLKPGYYQAHLDLGVLLKENNQAKEAALHFCRGIKENPRRPEGYFHMGLLYQEGGQLAEAEAFFQRVVALKPDYAKGYQQLGMLQVIAHNFKEAADFFRQAIAGEPDCAEAHNNLGLALRELNCLDEAEGCFSQAIRLNSGCAAFYNNLGLILRDKKQFTGAEKYLRQAISLQPEYPEAYNNLGLVLLAQECLQEAAQCLLQAVNLKLDYAEAYNNLGLVFKTAGRLDEAAECMRLALRFNPDYPEAYMNFGVIQFEANHPQEAVDLLRKSIELRPEYPEAYLNLGLVLEKLNKLAEAEANICRASKLRPGFMEAEFALGSLYLIQEEYEKGWEKYELRHTLFKEFQPELPRWQGETLAGRRILLYHEQGFGDTLQFVRYAQGIAELALDTVVWVQKPLAGLVAASSNAFTVYAGEHAPPGNFDFACPLLSLPLVCNTRANTIPGKIPYIKPPQALIEKWRERLQSFNQYRVGIAWAGNPRHKHDWMRSIPFPLFREMMADLPCSWISLQVGERAADLAAVGEMADFSQELHDFSETAALIANLDVVITIDSAVAHLAGAMGKSTWLLLALAPDWRWLLAREDSPWYASMRLFRQRQFGDWQEVLHRVKGALRASCT